MGPKSTFKPVIGTGQIKIVPVGQVDSDLLDNLISGLPEFFKAEALLADQLAVPKETYNRVRRQYHSTPILNELQLRMTRGSIRLLGVIDQDLYVPRLNFVFGEASLFGGVALIGLSRLRQEYYGLPADMNLFFQRTLKEAIHELGHTFHLDHCPESGCIMHFSNSIEDTDIKGPHFCKKCGEHLALRIEQGK